MATAGERRLAAVDDLLRDWLALANQLARGAYWVHQGDYGPGRGGESKAVEKRLHEWVAVNRALLPDHVVHSVAQLLNRITEWIVSMGESDTPAGMIQDKDRSFSNVQRVLSSYKEELIQEIDQQDLTDQATIARQVAIASRSPWKSGSFYLLAALLLLVTLLVVARAIPPWVLPSVVVSAFLFVLLIGAFQLKQDEKLSEDNFLKLLGLSLRALPSLMKLRRGQNDHPAPRQHSD